MPIGQWWHADSRRGTGFTSTRSQSMARICWSIRATRGPHMRCKRTRRPGRLASGRQAIELCDGPRSGPAYQHDVREEPDGTISFFDNGGTPKVHSQSRVIVLSLNRQNMTATLVSSFTHTPPLFGSEPGRLSTAGRRQLVRRLGPGTVLLGIRPRRQTLVRRPSPGALPVLHRAQVPLDRQSNAAATARRCAPALTGASSPTPAGTEPRPSRNGPDWAAPALTRSRHWRSLRAAASRRRSQALARPRYLAVQALGAQGQVLSTSAPPLLLPNESDPVISALAENVGNLSLRTGARSGMIERCPTRLVAPPDRDPRLPRCPEPRRHRSARGVRRRADADRGRRSRRPRL